jgi:hypothetical protein
MTVLVTLTLAGTDVGPFNLYSNVDGYTTPLATGVSRAALLAGYSLAGVPDAASVIRATSTGTCTNFLDMYLTGGTTTTTTSTSSTTSTTTTIVPPIECYGYEVCADDGSGDRDAFPFTYTNCIGNFITSSVVNTQCREICAQRDSVDSSSGAVFITETGPCL